VVGWSELFCLFIPMYLLTLRTMMLHLSHDLIVSSHFITVLGGNDVNLEVIFWEIWRKPVKPFSKPGAKMKKIVGKISSKLEV
jgi:hypothetical protein